MGGRLDGGKLAKLIYLADRNAIAEHCTAITGDDYCSMPEGPVPSRLCDLIKGKGDAQEEWDAVFRREGSEVVALRELPCDWLSELETDILDAVDSRFGSMSAEELSEWTRNPANCPEWKAPQGEPLPISKADILRALGKGDEAIAFILEEDAAHEAFVRSCAAKPVPS